VGVILSEEAARLRDGNRRTKYTEPYTRAAFGFKDWRQKHGLEQNRYCVKQAPNRQKNIQDATKTKTNISKLALQAKTAGQNQTTSYNYTHNQLKMAALLVHTHEKLYNI
jgi:hypothetical protein